MYRYKILLQIKTWVYMGMELNNKLKLIFIYKI
jgi:hypothetical protein